LLTKTRKDKLRKQNIATLVENWPESLSNFYHFEKKGKTSLLFL